MQALTQSTGRVSDESKAIARAASEQVSASQSLAQAAAEMRRMAKQTKDATGEQAHALRGGVKATTQLAATRAEGRARRRRAGDRRQPAGQGGRPHARVGPADQRGDGGAEHARSPA